MKLNKPISMKLLIPYSIAILIFSISCTTGNKGKETLAEKPNIIFILTDDQAWNLLGKDNQYPFMNTPNLDQLSKEGLVFENAFVTTSLCSPSRACFMTGCYAHTHGVYINSYADPDPDAPYLPEELQKAGYKTAFLGKWHMKPGAEPRKGFDYWYSFDGQGKYTDPEINENGINKIEKGYITDILTDHAINWISEQEKEPFCIFLWHKAVHSPFTPAPRDSLAFPGAKITEYESWYDDMEDKPEWLRRGWYYGVHNELWNNSKGKPVPDKIDPRPWDPQNPRWLNYLRAMLAVDDSYGRIKQTLEDIKILDNTVIIFGSDNGFFLGAHQRADKRLMYEESIRVPLIVRYPEMIKTNSKCSEMVLNIDLAPTLLELAGAKIPDDMQGRSFVPLLKNSNIEWRESFMYEYFQESYAPGLVTAIGVRNKKFKYIEFPHLPYDINELYNLENDPGEMDNLINKSEYQTVIKNMQAELEKLKTETNFIDPEVYTDK